MPHKPILLVEDNADDEALILRALRQHQLADRVIVARDGAEALTLLLGPAPPDGNGLAIPPDLVMLDLKLPKVSGFEVLRRIRSDPRTRMTPVVILTSSDEERDLLQGYDLGANSYVRKPVQFDEFIQAVGRLGLYWLLLNEPPPVGRTA